MKSKILIFSMAGLLMSLSSCVYWQSTCKKLLRKAEQSQPYDAIIVPGVPFDSLERNWSPIMKIRVFWSCYLYKKGIAKNIIFSGSAVYTPYIESEIMALYAAQIGIPAEHIFTESRAEHSTENIYYSYFLGKRAGFNRMAIASDPFQTKLLKSFAKQLKLNLDFLPMVFDSVNTMDLEMPLKINPSKAHVANFVSIEKREKFWKRFRGTLGKNLIMDSADFRYQKKGELMEK